MKRLVNVNQKNRMYKFVILLSAFFLIMSVSGICLYYIKNGGDLNTPDETDTEGDVVVNCSYAGKQIITTSNITQVIIDSVTPTTVEIVSPQYGIKLYSRNVFFQWTPSIDETEVVYDIFIFSDNKFNQLVSSITVSTTYYMFNIPDSAEYYWRVVARDKSGNVSSATTGYFVSQLGFLIYADKENKITVSQPPEIEVELPQGAVYENLQLYVSTDPLNRPLKVDNQHLDLILSDLSKKRKVISVIELILKTTDGIDTEVNFGKEVSLVYHYQDNDNDGMIDTHPTVFAKSLKVYSLNSDGVVKEVPTVVDVYSKTVRANLTHLSVYIFTGQEIPTTLNNVYVYPNPYRSSYGTNYVVFKNLTKDAVVRIYNIAGEFIAEIENKDNNDEEQWDLPKELASGVYIFVVKDNKGNKKIGKFAIVR